MCSCSVNLRWNRPPQVGIGQANGRSCDGGARRDSVGFAGRLGRRLGELADRAVAIKVQNAARAENGGWISSRHQTQDGEAASARNQARTHSGRLGSFSFSSSCAKQLSKQLYCHRFHPPRPVHCFNTNN
ncbi:hypothetical protein, variant 3 [Phytophthora nicotianae CJ01A1]|uniref:Uncharacterized protein n=2 Tax=Phytophthora nicotianae TaxID=4792 RepID=W2GND4_PHYNI|nr:hypothetical protein, variant 2 [Phytophthora nicotianae]ETP14347.1 hypothetical protein, variant 2 [Phytophthora nicotianae CJ01A1]ETK84509.1 hypothetical protein, variant 3 [Phytophthora nicotianae]ETL37948.1 hypothetical protein, variant 2 [Phytophthora nicotianae]ETL37949.1 hypothetical protein, variant 3 [Phytophthora nicotianae]